MTIAIKHFFIHFNGQKLVKVFRVAHSLLSRYTDISHTTCLMDTHVDDDDDEEEREK